MAYSSRGREHNGRRGVAAWSRSGKLTPGKQREQIWKQGEARNSQNLPPVMYFLQQAHTAFLKRGASWGASVQISEPMEEISHSHHHSTLWSYEK